jgi:hypothetical protein
MEVLKYVNKSFSKLTHKVLGYSNALKTWLYISL